MFNDVLKRSNERLSELPCCGQNGSVCNCVSVMNRGFTTGIDTYDCEKKMSTYVLKYGAAYASEIYHYLVASNFVSKVNTTRPLKVISLGCGFSPDYFAIKKYLETQNITLPISYTGVDRSTCWQSVRPNVDECRFVQADLTLPFPSFEADVVVVGKVFSTLYRYDRVAATAFLNNLKKAVNDSFQPNTRLIFVDVNNQDFGRDVFHQNMISSFTNHTQYYLGEGKYTRNNWSCISQKELVFEAPDNLSFQPHLSVGETVIFEYWN